jgi:hypothetical protein
VRFTLVFESSETTDNLPFQQYQYWATIKKRQDLSQKKNWSVEMYVAAGLMVMLAFVFVSTGDTIV